MSKKILRRDFLKGIGTMMGVVAAGSVMGVADVSANGSRLGLTDANGLTIRKRKYKYPWWVKKVNQITTEIDPDTFGPANPLNYNSYIAAMMPEDEYQPMIAAGKAHVKEGLENNIPGRTIPDLALHYAENAYFGGGANFDSPGLPARMWMPPGYPEIDETNLHPPQDFGLEPWQATPEEASKVIEQAGIQLGASMVGFTQLDPRWLYMNSRISSDVDEVQKIDGVTLIPERFKYMVVYISQGPRDLLIRAKSELGAAGGRATYSNTFIAGTKIRRFVKGLGHNVVWAQPYMPIIPPAISAGLGELGRQNRMINPIFGGNIRIDGLLTDLPLAMDSPIDFGLQEFCKHCKICAELCPVGALSLEDEPSWFPREYQSPGKKAYYEDSIACGKYQLTKASYCNQCLSACPWSKQDKAALHDFAKVISAMAPSAGNFLTDMDQAFGYSPIEMDSPEMEDWWDLDIPQSGIDTYQGKS